MEVQGAWMLAQAASLSSNNWRLTVRASSALPNNV
jgi:hypothetical protein